MLKENVVIKCLIRKCHIRKDLFDHIRSGFLVPDQKKSRFLISILSIVRSGLTAYYYTSIIIVFCRG